MRPLYGVALKLASTFVFALMLVCIKMLGARVPPGEVVFFRSFVGTVPVLAIAAAQGSFADAFRTPRPFGHLLRAFVGVGSMFLGFAAYQRLPLADALAIGYATPLFVVIIAALTLGEKVRVYRLTAVGIGFCGVMVVLWPHLNGLEHLLADSAALGAVLAFSSSIFGAFASTQVRRLSLWGEKSQTIVVYFSIGCTIASFVTIPFGWVWPSGTDLALLVAAGLAGGFGQLLMTRAYAHADATIVATLEYVSMLWAVGFGWLIFSELPGSTVVTGAAIIIASGLVIVLREHQLGLKRGAENLK